MDLEQVLFVHKEVDVFRIPPRVGAGGWRSGEWRLADKIFTGRCRVVSQGEKLEVRLEDASSGELFGVVPVPPGQAHIAVEQASDSSRNFVLRLEDAASRRHAFVGVSFAERSTAFDFNVAISDHERQQKRAAEIARISAAADPLAAATASGLVPEAAALFRPATDLSLKEGETIKITVKKKEAAPADGESFLSRLAHPTAAPPGSSTGRLMPLAPPPAQSAPAAGGYGAFASPVGSSFGTAATAPVQQHGNHQPQQAAPFNLLDGEFGAAPPAVPATAAPAAAASSAPAAEEGWATFE
ncbi:hypothetical protein ABPG77_000074 [Micractinium sp. CCAP 211/92]